jgi:acyl-CoA thioesterase-2
MGDLGQQTEVERVGDGRYRATMSRDWEIWGPMGGYAASFTLRAVGAELGADARPASFSCQYLGVAAFDEPVDIEVVALKVGRTVAFHRASLTQAGRPILEALVCSIGPSADGDHVLEHVEIEAPAAKGPDELKSFEELRPPEEGARFAFWDNVEGKPLEFNPDWPPTEPVPAIWRQWLRFRPSPSFPDPWIDACRAVILIDIQSWPAAHLPHAYRDPAVYAPSLDLYVAFHEPNPWSDWLLADGHSPVASGGLIGWTGRLWSTQRTLVASGGGQLLCRKVPEGATF